MIFFGLIWFYVKLQKCSTQHKQICYEFLFNHLQLFVSEWSYVKNLLCDQSMREIISFPWLTTNTLDWGARLSSAQGDKRLILFAWTTPNNNPDFISNFQNEKNLYFIYEDPNNNLLINGGETPVIAEVY